MTWLKWKTTQTIHHIIGKIKQWSRMCSAYSAHLWRNFSPSRYSQCAICAIFTSIRPKYIHWTHFISTTVHSWWFAFRRMKLKPTKWLLISCWYYISSLFELKKIFSVPRINVRTLPPPTFKWSSSHQGYFAMKNVGCTSVELYTYSIYIRIYIYMFSVRAFHSGFILQKDWCYLANRLKTAASQALCKIDT